MHLIKTNLQNANLHKIHLTKPFNTIFFHPDLQDCRRYFVTGGNSSGKSYSTAYYFLWRLMNYKGAKDIMLRQNLTHIGESQHDQIRRHIEMMEVEKYFDMSNNKNGPYHITFKPNKSTLIGRGFGNSDGFKNMSIAGTTGCWGEEASEFTGKLIQMFLTQARGANKTVPPKFIFTLNPVNKLNWTYTDFVGRHFSQLPESIPVKWYDKVEYIDANKQRQRVIVPTAAVRTTYMDNIGNLTPEDIFEVEKYKDVPGMEYWHDVAARGLYGSLATGTIFPRGERYKTYKYSELPNDCVGFIYCDPNFGKKATGDTTAIINLWISLSQRKKYVKSVRCFPCTDVNYLIESLLQLQDHKTIRIGFDGSFGQEAQWTHNITMYAQSKGIHIPQPDYMRPRVDAWSKNAQYHYNCGNILFPEDFGNDDESRLFLDQFHGFSGKVNTKGKMKDDAPDSLICAIQLAFENGYRFYAA